MATVTYGIINEAAGYAITNANSSAIGDMAFGNGHTAYVPGLSIPIEPESELLIHCFNEQPAGGFALDASSFRIPFARSHDPRTS